MALHCALCRCWWCSHKFTSFLLSCVAVKWLSAMRACATVKCNTLMTWWLMTNDMMLGHLKPSHVSCHYNCKVHRQAYCCLTRLRLVHCTWALLLVQRACAAVLISWVTSSVFCYHGCHTVSLADHPPHTQDNSQAWVSLPAPAWYATLCFYSEHFFSLKFEIVIQHLLSQVLLHLHLLPFCFWWKQQVLGMIMVSVSVSHFIWKLLPTKLKICWTWEH